MAYAKTHPTTCIPSNFGNLKVYTVSLRVGTTQYTRTDLLFRIYLRGGELKHSNFSTLLNPANNLNLTLERVRWYGRQIKIYFRLFETVQFNFIVCDLLAPNMPFVPSAISPRYFLQ